MNLITRYNGTVHPEEWLKQVQTICIINKIRQERDILKLCKLNIDTSIILPNKTNTLDKLAKVLKAHFTFEIYKSGCKHRLDQMSSQGNDKVGDITKFLANFRSLCFKAEIINPQEIKARLLKTFSSNEFLNEFSKRISGVTSVDEIYRLYSEVISDSSKTIKYGPEFSIATEHLATSRYLSSISTNYQTGSKRQVIFGGEKILDGNCWRYLTCEVPDLHKDEFQKNKVLYVYRSSRTSYAEVHGFQCSWANLKNDLTNQENNTPYLKVRDRGYIRTETDYILRSQDVTFKIENNNDNNDKSDTKSLIFQGNVGHKEQIDRDDVYLLFV
ncbi:hypothetical protein RclHR1_01140005 [Rhizophagus clarus]|uniref:MIR domain-containing protein n=1 Tax=Rhizophagus clarus TaxID=94130 RepID=A0A2Z6QX50_9GLOM|nr:hypothetical protein RclHR1_01140005 [Rhizophagus clarus]GES94882.1 hypothetical protein GLOIN_2v620650 [Rhizophagus clarus]